MNNINKKGTILFAFFGLLIKAFIKIADMK
jgi:hypothetical protein